MRYSRPADAVVALRELPRQEFLDAWYEHFYADSAYGGVSGRIQSWMHSSLERKYRPQTYFSRVLEVGGNVGEHVPFVNHGYGTYCISDISDRRNEHERSTLSRKSVEFVVASAEELPFDVASFDRALMTCVLHHLDDPELALSEFRRVVRPGGFIDLFIPSDPGIAFRFAKRVGPLRKASRQGLLDIKQLVDARDHRNHVAGLLTIARHVFRADKVAMRSYPAAGLPWDLSLWTCLRVLRCD